MEAIYCIMYAYVFIVYGDAILPMLCYVYAMCCVCCYEIGNVCVRLKTHEKHYGRHPLCYSTGRGVLGRDDDTPYRVLEFTVLYSYRKWRNMVKEVWKNVNGYNDLYEVSNLGNIRMCKTKVCKSFKIDKDGYATVRLREDGRDKFRFVHRIVAITFIDNPQCKPEVNHIDGGKQHNTLSNLEWVTSMENEMHAIQNGLITPRKSVVGTHKNTNETIVFESINEAVRKTKENRGGITAAIHGRRLGTQNYYWKLAL